MLRQVSVSGFGLTVRPGSGAVTGYLTSRGDRDAAAGNPQLAVFRSGEQSANKGAEQDRDEGSSLDHGVAADQFVFVQVLGQQCVLHRAEQRGVAAEQEQRCEQHRQAVQQEAR